MAENEKSSTDGSLSLLPARPADRAEGFCEVFPFMLGNRRGVFGPEDGRELWREPEYVRTTTGWLDKVVRLDVDFADLLFGFDEAWD